ncbi:MAG TPA: hypothetical protein VGM43_07205 [Bryobacteraceae bacterium]
MRSAPVDIALPELARRSDAVLVYEASAAPEIEESLAALVEELPAGEQVFIALVPRAAAPATDSAYGEPISSFVCSAGVFLRFLDLGIDCYPETLCFAVLRAIADGDIEVDRLLVRQIPLASRDVAISAAAAPGAALVLPHRGSTAFLRASLKQIARAAGRPVKVRVGLDVDDESLYTSFPEEFPDAEFFHFSPAPVGPYLIRQQLAERSPEPLLTLQDSDDLSCYDRFTSLSAALDATASDIIGSHELCLDELRAVVQPVRFPLDGSASLGICANHALLHATLLCRREAFFRAGGLATNLIIASDSQFLLRAWFSARIRNVDEFLYIRRRHATSLTNAPETVYDNPLRRRLSADWIRDFGAVKRGELTLEASTLWPAARQEPFEIRLLTAQDKYTEVAAQA